MLNHQEKYKYKQIKNSFLKWIHNHVRLGYRNIADGDTYAYMFNVSMLTMIGGGYFSLYKI